MAKSIPPHPNLEYDKKQAKRLVKAVHQHDETALIRIRTVHPRYMQLQSDMSPNQFTLADAHLVIAREYGFLSWKHYKNKLGELMETRNLFDQAIEAIITGDVNTLKTILKQHPELVTTRGYKGASLLHYVSANGVENRYQKTPSNAVEIAEIVFQAGANPNVKADFYSGGAASTPLVGLVSSAHPYEAGVQVDLVHTYIKYGANPDGIDNDGRPLTTALEFWYPDAFKALVKLGGHLTNIVYAAAAGEQSIVESMLKEEILQPYVTSFGEIITERDVLLNLAFVKACLCGQLETVKQLHQYGIDVNVTVKQHRTGLHEAAWLGHDEIIAYLLQEGADASIKDEQFDSMPIQWAYLRGHQTIFDMLLPYSPLSIEIAAQFGLLDTVKKYLIENPNYVNGRDGTGAPLRAAIAYRHIDIVAYLLQQGASKTLTNANGLSASELAQRIGNQEIIALLEA